MRALTAPTILLISVLATAGPSWATNPILTRVAEEAEKFAAGARSFVTRETLTQRVAAPRRWYRPRLGKSGRTAVVQYRTRVLESEYAFSAPMANRAGIHEVRSVLTVDGQPVQQAGEARTVLIAGLEEPDDRIKQNLLRDFAHHLGGDAGVIDLGQILLLFGKEGQQRFEYEEAEAEPGVSATAQGLRFRQTEGKAALTVFERKRAVRHPLEGTIWWDPEGAVPLRITLLAMREQDGRAIREEATVDYNRNHDGILLPSEILHRQISEGQLAVEHRFQYAPFRRFGAETGIYFDLPAPQGCAESAKNPCPAP